MYYNQKINFCVMHWKKLLITSPYHNNPAQKLNSHNRMHDYANSVFCQAVHFTICFPKINSLKTYCAYFFGQVEISSGKYPINMGSCKTRVKVGELSGNSCPCFKHQFYTYFTPVACKVVQLFF